MCRVWTGPRLAYLVSEVAAKTLHEELQTAIRADCCGVMQQGLADVPLHLTHQSTLHTTSICQIVHAWQEKQPKLYRAGAARSELQRRRRMRSGLRLAETCPDVSIWLGTHKRVCIFAAGAAFHLAFLVH